MERDHNGPRDSRSSQSIKHGQIKGSALRRLAQRSDDFANNDDSDSNDEEEEDDMDKDVVDDVQMDQDGAEPAELQSMRTTAEVDGGRTTGVSGLSSSIQSSGRRDWPRKQASGESEYQVRIRCANDSNSNVEQLEAP